MGAVANEFLFVEPAELGRNGRGSPSKLGAMKVRVRFGIAILTGTAKLLVVATDLHRELYRHCD